MSAALTRVNPVTRVLLAVLLSLPVIITLDWLSATVVLVACLALAPLTGLGWRRLLPRLVPLLVVAPLAAASMALYGQPGGRRFIDWGLVVVSEQSLWLALAVFLRVFALGVPTIALLTTVDPTDMADGLAQVLRLPARLVLGTLAAVRMLGLFVEDWRTLGHARRARGLGDDGWWRRWLTMAFTLMVFALRRGTRLATAMEARGFGAGHRSWARPSRVGWPDAVALVVAVLIGAGALVAAWWFDTLWVVAR